MIKYSRFTWFIMPLAIAIIVSAITALNNYYFYKSKEITEYHSLKNYSNLILLELQNCLGSGVTDLICEEISKTSIKESNISGITKFTKNKDVLISIDNESYKDSRKPVNALSSIKVNSNIYEVEMEKLVTPSLIKSTFNSVTFSIYDLINLNSNDKEGFIKNVAWPRSYPAISFFFVILFSFFLASLKLKTLYSTIEKTQNKIDSLSIEISSTKLALANKQECLASLSQKKEEEEIKAKMMADEIVELEHSLYDVTTTSDNQRKQFSSALAILKEKKEKSDKINKILSSEIFTTTSELEECKETISQLNSTINTLQIEQTKAKQSKSYTPIKNELIKYLLSNPDINIKNNEYKVNTGPHHSKTFVEKLDSIIKNSKKFEKLHNAIKSLTPIAYSQKRGVIELILDQSKKLYVLNVYDNGDEGFGAQIVLATENYFEALMISKCLINTLTPLNSFKLKVR